MLNVNHIIQASLVDEERLILTVCTKINVYVPCSLLLSLDRATLQLLVENPRVETFQPGLVSFLTEACQNRRQEVSQFLVWVCFL